MRLALALILLVMPVPVLAAGPAWYDCIARGSSHTGRYTFRIATGPCAVYWRELGRDLEIIKCAPPLVVAIKPFAVSAGWELHFDLASGAFEDFTPSWSDRGRCVRRGDGAKPG